MANKVGFPAIAANGFNDANRVHAAAENIGKDVHYYYQGNKRVEIRFTGNNTHEDYEVYDVPQKHVIDDLDVLNTAIKYTISGRIYMNIFVDIREWFRNHRQLSYYIVLAIGSSLVIGGAVLTAFTGPVGLVLTAVGNVLIAQIAPAVRGIAYTAIREAVIDGGLQVQNREEQHTLFNEGKNNKAGYIKIQDINNENAPRLEGNASWGSILQGVPEQDNRNRVIIGNSYEPYDITLENNRTCIIRRNNS